MKVLILIWFIATQVSVFGQAQNEKKILEDIFESLLAEERIIDVFHDYPNWITTYQFIGDYSVESVYPNTPQNMVRSGNPITFKEPIYLSLKQLDKVYDSMHYIHQIETFNRPKWTSLELDLKHKIKFVNSGALNKLRFEIGTISVPLFSKDMQLAVISYRTTKGSSVIKDLDKVFILKWTGNGWTTLKTIDSIKTW
jgi:hypothetical protein